MDLIDKNIIDRFEGALKDILKLELNAGNQIVETYEGDWPAANTRMIFLEKPFLTPIQTKIENVEYRILDSGPHYWKSEYFDKTKTQHLCDKF